MTHADRASYLSTTQLAELAHVSQPSVTRFANALGFDGYPQLRSAMREAGNAPASADIRPVNEWQRSIDFEIAAMGQVRDSLSRDDEIRAVAARLVVSKPLVVAGHRSAASIAQYFAYFASRFLDDVRVVPTQATGGDVDVLLQAKAAGGTCVLVIALPRYAEETLSFIDHAKSFGFDVTCLTDSVASPAADTVDHLLIAPVDSSLIFDSYGVPMMVLSVLLSAMSEVDEELTQTRLEAFDAIALRNGIFRDS